MKNILLVLAIIIGMTTWIGCDTDNPLVDAYLQSVELNSVEPPTDPIGMQLTPYSGVTHTYDENGSLESSNQFSGWKITTDINLLIQSINAEKVEENGITIENSLGRKIDLFGTNHHWKWMKGKFTIRSPIQPVQVHSNDGFIGYNIRDNDDHLIVEVRYAN